MSFGVITFWLALVVLAWALIRVFVQLAHLYRTDRKARLVIRIVVSVSCVALALARIAAEYMK